MKTQIECFFIAFGLFDLDNFFHFWFCGERNELMRWIERNLWSKCNRIAQFSEQKIGLQTSPKIHSKIFDQNCDNSQLLFNFQRSKDFNCYRVSSMDSGQFTFPPV